MAEQCSPSQVSESFYRSITENAGVAIIAGDREKKIRCWNQGASRIFGGSAELMLGESLLSVIPEGRRRLADRLVRRALDGRECSEFEYQHRDVQGNPCHLSVMISPVIDPDGATIGVSLYIYDITRRVNLEKQVAHKKKLASLGALSGAMVHHFNNILGGIVTSVDFALASGDPKMNEKVMRQAASSLARASRLLKSLSAFAEGVRQNQDLSDLTEVVLYFADGCEDDLASAGIRLVIEVKAMPVVAVPTVQMLTVLSNLLSNARDAMPEGGTLLISLKPGDGEVILQMSDDGGGIEPEIVDRVFEPFFGTKASSPDDDAANPGLGLAVVHGIVSEMGGRIEARSTVGHGTTFEIRLPLSDAIMDSSAGGSVGLHAVETKSN